MKTQLNKSRHIQLISIVALPILLLTISCSSKAGNSGDAVAGPETVLVLPPGDDNPRNSEGDFIKLKDGKIMFIYSRYTGSSSSDHAPAYLAARYSEDGGKTWTKEDKVIIPKEGDMNVMSVSLLRLQNGNIALFYLKKNSVQDCLPLMRISGDEGRTWSNPVTCITDKEGYFVLNNARVIQLHDGRLMMAVALHHTPDGEWQNKADLYSYYSDDNGKTWISSDRVPNTTDIITQEPGLIELRDGRIMMYIRASGNYQQLSFSSDRGVTWSHIAKSNIASPLSPATIEKIPETDDWLLIWNNNDGSIPELNGKRTPLTAAISKDEGKTWENIKNIHDDPDGWYCYMAVRFVDKEHVLLGYCAGSQSQKTHLSVTNVTKINKKWLYE